jgi:hypothetical protein
LKKMLQSGFSGPDPPGIQYGEPVRKPGRFSGKSPKNMEFSTKSAFFAVFKRPLFRSRSFPTTLLYIDFLY